MNPRIASNLVDVVAWAERGRMQSGATPLRSYLRLAQSVRASSDDSVVAWQVAGEWRATPDAVRRPALALMADVVLPLTCQRCLDEVRVTVHVDRHLVFALDEARAALLDADADDDVLALTQPLDLQNLIEDELILALPMIPHHATCPAPPVTQVRSDGFEATLERGQRPFEALAHLKTRDST